MTTKEEEVDFITTGKLTEKIIILIMIKLSRFIYNFNAMLLTVLTIAICVEAKPDEYIFQRNMLHCHWQLKP